MNELNLYLALIATIIGPLIYILVRRQVRYKPISDTFILVITAGIILFQALPESYDSIGLLSLLLLILGTSIPRIIELLFRKAAEKTHFLTLVIAIMGLVIHGVVDGSALTMNQYEQGSLIPLAIMLHRAPISMTLWWLIKPQFGQGYAIGVVFVLLLATFLGFQYSYLLMDQLHNKGFMAFQSLISGTLLHVLYHKPGHHDHHQEMEKPQFKLHMIGAGIALLLLLILLNLNNIH